MKVRIHEIDIDGTPVAYTGEYYVGANATEIVEAMKKEPVPNRSHGRRIHAEDSRQNRQGGLCPH